MPGRGGDAVGFPVALAFSKKYSRVIGFDINRSRIDELKAGHDRTNETDASSLKASKLVLTCDVADLREATFGGGFLLVLVEGW